MLSHSLFLLFAATWCGAFFYRMRGGAPSWPRPIEQMLFCSVLLFSMVAFGVVWWLTGSAYAAAVAACLTGHGTYFLSLSVESVEPERFDFLIRPFFGYDPRSTYPFIDLRGKDSHELTEEQRQSISTAMVAYGMRKLYWRGVAGLSLTGVIVTLIPGIAIMTEHFGAGLLVALSGAIKGPMYMLSHWRGWGTEGGEYGNGGAVWFLVTLWTLLMVSICAVSA